MFCNPYFSCCFESPKSERQKEDELRDYLHHKEEICNLPLDNGWKNLPLRLYQGFWFLEAVLPGVLSLRRHLRPAPSDIFLVTFPKSGTTWLKALAYAIHNRSSSPSSSPNRYRELLTRHPQDCSPYLEGLFSGPLVPNLDALPSPRHLGTHIPLSVLPESVRGPNSACRIVYLCREPKDTLVSTYHFVDGLRSNKSTAEPMTIMEAVELFCKGLSPYGPVWDHQLEYWRESLKRPDKVLFLKYEDMKVEPEANVRKLAEFMGRPFSEVEESSGMVAEIVRLCCFENLSGLEVNKVGVRGKEVDWAINSSSFFRKGKVGDWREHVSEEMAEKVDGVTRNKLQDTGLSHWLAPPGQLAQVEEMP